MSKPVREATTSVWMSTAEIPRHQTLTKDEKADVCVIGAGILGAPRAWSRSAVSSSPGYAPQRRAVKPHR
jgi:hypothetical protein